MAYTCTMKTYLPLLALFFYCNGYAQQNLLFGQVIDADNQQPVSNCSVFISNSSLGTITDSTGKFNLNNIPLYPSLRLVVSSVGFETFTYDFSAHQLPLNLKININRQVVELSNVQVIPYEKNGWQKWGNTFMRYFLGESENAYDCQIDNSYAIKFRNNTTTKVLEAFADEAIIIRNYHLGYLVKYKLEKFEYDFQRRTVHYEGYPLFFEMDQTNISPQYRWKRLEAYHGSLMHFIRSVCKNRLKEEGFAVRRIERIAANDTIINDGKTIPVFFRKDSTGKRHKPLYMVKDFKEVSGDSLLTKDSIVITGGDAYQLILSFKGDLQVKYLREEEPKAYAVSDFIAVPHKYQQSRLRIVNPEKSVLIFPQGYCYPPLDVYIEGYMAWEKIGDLLPIDYDPEE